MAAMFFFTISTKLFSNLTIGFRADVLTNNIVNCIKLFLIAMHFNKKKCRAFGMKNLFQKHKVLKSRKLNCAYKKALW